jgi:hypothetical protein
MGWGVGFCSEFYCLGYLVRQFVVFGFLRAGSVALHVLVPRT